MANANLSKAAQAVMKAISAMFGGKKGSGFVSTPGATKPGDLQRVPSVEQVRGLLERYHGRPWPQDGEPAAIRNLRTTPSLQTEKDGRIFAFDVLERLQGCDENEGAALAYIYNDPGFYGIEQPEPMRKEPQWSGFYNDLSLLIHARPEAVKGFASIFTDALAGKDTVNINDHRENEKAGRFLPFGTPGTAYPMPEQVKPEAAPSLEKPKAKKAKEKTADQKAQEIIKSALSVVFVLDDMARQFKRSAISYESTTGTVNALADKLRGRLATCASVIGAKHPAQKPLRSANLTLDALCEVMKNSDGGESEFTSPRRIIGAGMLAIVQAIGRDVERAQLTFGGAQSGVYLNVEG